MTKPEPSLLELRETDALLDQLAERRTPTGPAADDPAIILMAQLADAVDAVALLALSGQRRAATGGVRQGSRRSRRLGAALAVGLTFSSSGIAAAATGDPLLPVKVVVKQLYDFRKEPAPDSHWMLGAHHRNADHVHRVLSPPMQARRWMQVSQVEASAPAKHAAAPPAALSSDGMDLHAGAMQPPLIAAAGEPSGDQAPPTRDENRSPAGGQPSQGNDPVVEGSGAPSGSDDSGSPSGTGSTDTAGQHSGGIHTSAEPPRPTKPPKPDPPKPTDTPKPAHPAHPATGLVAHGSPSER